MVLHYATPLLEGYAVPFTLLRKRVDEEILGPCRLGIAWLPEVLRWPEHCKVGVRGREILPKPGVQQVRMELLDGVQGVCYQPKHEVRVSGCQSASRSEDSAVHTSSTRLETRLSKRDAGHQAAVSTQRRA